MLLKLERPTTKAKAYTEWELAPEVVVEDEESRKIYEQVFVNNNTVF
jgi:hypothetical protein